MGPRGLPVFGHRYTVTVRLVGLPSTNTGQGWRGCAAPLLSLHVLAGEAEDAINVDAVQIAAAATAPAKTMTGTRGIVTSL
jgi:hypothetical protein